jgi:hypothetical protein
MVAVALVCTVWLRIERGDCVCVSVQGPMLPKTGQNLFRPISPISASARRSGQEGNCRGTSGDRPPVRLFSSFTFEFGVDAQQAGRFLATSYNGGGCQRQQRHQRRRQQRRQQPASTAAAQERSRPETAHRGRATWCSRAKTGASTPPPPAAVSHRGTERERQRERRGN